MSKPRNLGDQIKKLKQEGLTFLEIVEQLQCSKGTVSYHLNPKEKDASKDRQRVRRKKIKDGLPTNRESKPKINKKASKICLQCNCIYNTRGVKFCSTTCAKQYHHIYQREYYGTNKHQILVKNNYNRKLKKSKLIQLLGNQCCLCTYDKCHNSLHFHHVEPKDKKFHISNIQVNWRLALEEVKKCILVCANCHGEIEAGNIDKELIYTKWKTTKELLNSSDTIQPKTILRHELKI